MKKLLIASLLISSLFIGCKSDDVNFNTETEETQANNQGKGWVTLAQSKKAAVSRFNSQLKSKGESDTPKFTEKDIKESFGITDENQNTLIYIHNLRNGGFVMMSGSVYEVPVLAYSNEGTIDIEDMPDELSQWLYLGSKKIAYLQEKKSSYIPTSWSNELGLIDQWGNWHPIPEFEVTILEEYDENVKGPLLNALWGQARQYNLYAPNLGCSDTRTGVNAYAGCVPTAMGQIMHYHQWPNTNNYNWSIMPQRLYDDTTSPNYNIGTNGHKQIAQLLRNLGIQLGATYQCGGTGASNDNVKGVFNTNSYSASNLIDYNYETVKNQMAINRPVYVSGMNERITNYAIRWTIFGTKLNMFKSYSYKGHAWVADGTKQHVVISKSKNLDTNQEYISTTKSKYIHFNWGWTEAWFEANNYGNCNGWYYYDLFYPGYDTDEFGNIFHSDDFEEIVAEYTMKRRMIINITPN